MSARIPFIHKETTNNDCDPNSLNAGTSETQQLVNTLLINAVVFVVLMLCFEASRNLKSIYLKQGAPGEQRTRATSAASSFLWLD
jgi:hypothetical protein